MAFLTRAEDVTDKRSKQKHVKLPAIFNDNDQITPQSSSIDTTRQQHNSESSSSESSSDSSSDSSDLSWSSESSDEGGDEALSQLPGKNETQLHKPRMLNSHLLHEIKKSNKPKKQRIVFGKPFAGALRAILSAPVPANRHHVLCKRPEYAQKLAKRQIEEKKKRVAAARKKQNLTKGHIVLMEHRTLAWNPQEAMLCRTATRGVVQLFNAVQSHQEKIRQAEQEEQDKLKQKSQALLPELSGDNFLDLLHKTKQKQTSSSSSSWSALQKGFMTSASLKDWDQDESNDDSTDDDDEQTQQQSKTTTTTDPKPKSIQFDLSDDDLSDDSST